MGVPFSLLLCSWCPSCICSIKWQWRVPFIPAPAAPRVINFVVFSEVPQDCSWQQLNGQSTQAYLHHLPRSLPSSTEAPCRNPAGPFRHLAQRRFQPVEGERRDLLCVSGHCVCHGAGGICQPVTVRTGYSRCQSVLRRGHLPWTRVSPDPS